MICAEGETRQGTWGCHTPLPIGEIFLEEAPLPREMLLSWCYSPAIVRRALPGATFYNHTLISGHLQASGAAGCSGCSCRRRSIGMGTLRAPEPAARPCQPLRAGWQRCGVWPRVGPVATRGGAARGLLGGKVSKPLPNLSPSPLRNLTSELF